MISLLIVQPYLPSYRVEFFDSLVTRLRDDNISCRIAAGAPMIEQAFRRDVATAPHWLIPLSGSPKRIGRVIVANYGSYRCQLKANAIIVGLLGSSPDSYAAVALGMLSNKRIGVWGHIEPAIKSPNKLDLALERWQMRRADHVFAYTQGGANYAIHAGVPATKVTAVQNSVDVAETKRAHASLTQLDVDLFSRRHDLTVGRTAAFIGGLDEAKRIEFLRDALDHIWLRDRQFRLLVAGRGKDEYVLHEAAARGQVVLLGYCGAEEKAKVLRTAQCIAMPGRIGLVAIEALAFGLPIVTTEGQLHAPEIEYLVEGTSLVVSPDTVKAYANKLLETTRLNNDHPTWNYPGLPDMVANFTAGILKMLD